MNAKSKKIIAAAAVLIAGTAAAAILRYPSFFKLIPSIDGSGTMKITSTDFEQGGPIPARYTCDGANISPPLRVSGVPEEAKTLALIVDDPDAAGGGWTHWTVWNIPAAESVEIAENSAPGGAVEGVTDFGRSGYGGPCPPSGEHHYFFKAYALDAVLDIPEKSDVRALEAAIQDHVIDKAGLIGVYTRR